MSETNKLQADLEDRREIFEVLASLVNEDASVLNLGSMAPDARQDVLVDIAQRFARVNGDLEEIRKVIADAVEEGEEKS